MTMGEQWGSSGFWVGEGGSGVRLGYEVRLGLVRLSLVRLGLVRLGLVRLDLDSDLRFRPLVRMA